MLLKGRIEDGLPHSLYRGLLKFPPEGYGIFMGKAENGEKWQSRPLAARRQIINELNLRLQKIPCGRLGREGRTILYMGLKTAQNMRLETVPNPDLVFAPQQLMFSKTPWVTDFEYANALVDYGDIRLSRRFIQKALRSSFCRKIMPWSEWAKRTLLRSLDCNSFKEKIEVVHFGLEERNFAKKKNNGQIRLLFVGSVNQFNYLNFEWKGGLEVIEAFLKLSKKYDALELVVRSWVPPEVKEKYADKPNLRILDKMLNEEDLNQLFSTSDIFLFPSHVNLGMAILEAMSYELPVIAFNLYDIPEAIQDMKTGILMDPPPTVPYYVWNGAPNHQDTNLLPRIRLHKQWIVNRIIDKTSLLIEDGSLRGRIGREARNVVARGEFSLAARNQKLKKIFDEATNID